MDARIAIRVLLVDLGTVVISPDPDRHGDRGPASGYWTPDSSHSPMVRPDALRVRLRVLEAPEPERICSRNTGRDRERYPFIRSSNPHAGRSRKHMDFRHPPCSF